MISNKTQRSWRQLAYGVVSAVMALALMYAFFAQAANIATESDFSLNGSGSERNEIIIDTTGYENLTYSFTVDYSDLDTGETFSFGYVDGGDNQLEMETATAGDDSSGTVVVSATYNTESLTTPAGPTTFYFEINASDTNDETFITNFSIDGDLIPSDYTPPSTNEDNETNGDGYVELVSATTDSVTLNFVNPNSYAMCFEYRTDGDTSEIVSTNGGENYNPAVTSGLYPFLCLNASSTERTIDADDYVEVRSVFGAERDVDFDWTLFNVAEPKTETTIEVSGDDFDGTSGWLFNRDQSTKTEFEFTEDEQSIGDGSLYVLPIDGNINGDKDKFIGEYFTGNMLVEDFNSLSYDFQIAGNGTVGAANEFYTNLHANFPGNENNYGDCKFDYVPSSGTTGSFTTFSFAASDTPYRVRGTGCPATLADMPDGSTIFFFSINVGDTSNNDNGLAGYYDNVVLETNTAITTFDFEKGPVDPNNENFFNISGFKFQNQDNRSKFVGVNTGTLNKLSGWEMRLYKETESDWSLVATSTTDANGNYKFPAQGSAGTYYVCEVMQLGWTQAYQNWSTYNVSTDNDSPNADEEGPYCATLGYTDEADRSVKRYFGNIMNDPDGNNQFTQIGIKFENENEDRDRDLGEEKIPGWEFNFYKEVNDEWVFIASTTTDVDGKYKFPQQTEPGVYHVCEMMQEGWTQVRQDWGGTPYHIVTDNLSPNAAVEGPYCSTATYDDSKDRSNAKYFGNVQDDEPLVATLLITNPEFDNDLVSASEQVFTALYTDDDDTVDTINWAIKPGSCEANDLQVNILGYGTDGYMVASYDPETGEIEVDVDLSDFEPGDYCFVVNPAETGGESDTDREIRLFTIPEPPAEASLEILTPPSLETISGTYDFTAEYIDDDDTEDNIQWAVRFETCSGSSNTVAGNVDGYSDSSTFSGGLFSATLDTTVWIDGEYCFIVNPSEQSGEDNLRATQIFFVDNSADDDSSTTTDDTNGTSTEQFSTSSSGSSSSGTRVGFQSANVQPLVLGASTSQCGKLLSTYMEMGGVNDPWEVMKLQAFLVGQGYFDVKMTGTFDLTTHNAVIAYQELHKAEVLTPWVTIGLATNDNPTGKVYLLTRWKINNTICAGSEAYPSLHF